MAGQLNIFTEETQKQMLNELKIQNTQLETIANTETGLGNNGQIAEGSVWVFYKGATQTNRIKRDRAALTAARYRWLCSPFLRYVRITRGGAPDGALSISTSPSGFGAAAADDAGADSGMMDMPTGIEGSETDGEQEV